MSQKWNKPLKVLLVIWLALGLLAMLYVVFFYKKSAFFLALIFMAGFLAISMPLRKLEDQKRDEAKDQKDQKS